MKTFLGLTRAKLAATAGVGLLGAGILGGVAFAAAPSASDGIAMAALAPAAATTADKGRGDKADALKAILKGLVDKNVITQVQADAILDAIQKAHDGKGDHKRIGEFLGDVLKGSANYLGTTPEQLRAELAKGASLGQIANTTAGKSRQGLIDTLTKAANDRIADAVKAGKITAEQGEKLKTSVGTAIVKVVDHEGGKAKRTTTKPNAPTLVNPTPKPTT